MSTEMSVPLGGTPDGTSQNAHVTNTCVTAEGDLKKTPIFISGVSDIRSLLAWLRSSCPDGLIAQLKSEKSTVVPPKNYGSRTAVIALRSLDGKHV